MNKIFILLTVLLGSYRLQAQFKNDNVLYRTVYPEDLCKELKGNNNFLLLDVRSRGEYEDTSASPGYNLGHLRDAVNINVKELGNRLPEIGAFRDKPVYVYCSHSQRSRRASKMLADSGFKNIININGGVTAIRQLTGEDCLNNMMVSKVGYNIVSPLSLCKKLSGGASRVFVLDVRSDSAFRHIDRDAKNNAFGVVRQSSNIPLQDLEKRLGELPRDKEILVTDLFGDDAARAAHLLVGKGFKNVSMLLEGVDRIHFTDSRELGCLQDYYTNPVKYKLISSMDFSRLAESTPGYLPLDTRTEEEFANKHKDNYRNIGHLVNAVNIPAGALQDRIREIDQYKNRPVVLYGFSGNREVYEAANLLIKNGFINVNVLAGGIFNVRWTAGNVSGYSDLSRIVTGIPAENL